ncbi:MAG: PH domain-containing protein [Dehalococcoidia bacterium]
MPISGIFGHASITNIDDAKTEFGDLLIRREEILSAYKWVRDQIVFTTHRIIMVDSMGITGRKKNFVSIPYGSIHKFSKESAGWADWDAELRVWIRGEEKPIKWEFKKDAAVNEIFQILSEGVLAGEPLVVSQSELQTLPPNVPHLPPPPSVST